MSNASSDAPHFVRAGKRLRLKSFALSELPVSVFRDTDCLAVRRPAKWIHIQTYPVIYDFYLSERP